MPLSPNPCISDTTANSLSPPDRGEQCGGCRRSNTTDRPHSFQVILTDRPSLELSAENEEEMADWMQYLCQAVSKGVRKATGLRAIVQKWRQRIGAGLEGSFQRLLLEVHRA